MSEMIGATAGCCGAGIMALLAGRKSVHFLSKDEQLRIQKLTDVEVQNGPGLKVLLPFSYRSAQVVKAETLGTTDYVKVKDKFKGSQEVVQGPTLLFLGPYEEVEFRGKGLSLTSTEYVTIENKVSGDQLVQRGPCMWFPGPEEEGTKGNGISLSGMEYVLVKDQRHGTKRVEKGPCIWFPKPFEVASKASGISLSSTDYVLVEDKLTGEKRIQQGPCIWFPGPDEQGQKGTGISLSSTEYVLVEDKLTGEKTIQKGPCVWFPGPQEQGQKGAGISLSSTEYIFVEDRLTGAKSMVKGPCVWFPSPYDAASEVKEAVALQTDEYLRLKDLATGQRWVQTGKTLVFLQPTWKIETTGAQKGREAHGIRKAWALKKYEYIRLVDSVTGQVTTHHGEATTFPGPEEYPLDEDKQSAIDLKVNEYVKILDQATGQIRVVAGAEQVFLGPHEKILHGGKQKAIVIDDEHAALVRDKGTGQLRLVTDNQLFVPGPHESIEKVQNLIKLAAHEAMIIKDKDGIFKYFFGTAGKSDNPRSFFLPPYSEVVRLNWSRGRRREKRDLYIDRFDCRSQYMSFEFNCRTKDNVELILEGTFFWEVVDLPRMVQTTGDTSGDICNHARSQFIKHVARVSLKEFMDDLNVISNKVYEEDNNFYESRGVKVHSLEVTGYKCAEESTSEVLQQIIAETTNRMNRLSQQESENEVKIFKMQGDIEQERIKSELLCVQHEHAQSEAKVSGASEADRVAAFIQGLVNVVPSLEDRIAMWQTLRKTEALAVVSEGGASLYYTPADVNLSIESKPKIQTQACGNS